MGREVKRVALDFKWPLNKVWKGYLNPYYDHMSDCSYCDGSGYNPATKELYDTWYADGDESKAWHLKLTQFEVDALLEHNRLYDLTHVWDGHEWNDTGYRPTADEVNQWASHGIGHDCCNQHICVKFRAERLGVYGECEYCGGEGSVWTSPKWKKLCEEWEQTEPPVGEGWQVWETVSEGSPVSPVFATRESLIDYLVNEGHSRLSAERFVEDAWCPSMVIVGGQMFSGIDSCGVLKEK